MERKDKSVLWQKRNMILELWTRYMNYEQKYFGAVANKQMPKKMKKNW